jgi:cytochrome c
MNPRWIAIPVITLVLFSAGHALLNEVPVAGAQTDRELSPEALAKKSGCLRCHGIEKWVVGPPYREIAERYKDDARARATLIETVKKGGKGNWSEGGVPMPPHAARVSASDTERLVDWVLSLKKED